MPLIDTETLETELHAVAVAQRDHLRYRAVLERCAAGQLDAALADVDRAYQRYIEALMALGERVASLVDLEPPPMHLTIIEAD